MNHSNTTPHRATPEQWGQVQSYADVDCYSDSCLLELRDRLAAVEQRISELEGNSARQEIREAEAFGLVPAVEPPELSEEVADALHEGPGNSEDSASCARRIYRAGWDAAMAAAVCPHIRTSDEGTSYCGLAEQVAAEPMPGMTDCFFVGPPPAPHKSVSEWYEQEGSKGILHGLYISPLPSRGGPKPGHVRDATEMVPAGSLVEQVAIACAKPCNETWDDQARAAIREVAAWMREQHGYFGAATVLEQEAKRA